MDVRAGREKILYVEGEPRDEMAFIRRAVDADSNIQVVALQRTAENKFLRLGVDGPDELASGFPKTRAELFRYRAIILGSIEASFFTHDQLAMLADFVNVRGGGLLMLGGRDSFAEGGYAGTPLADVMPIVVTRQRGSRFADVLRRSQGRADAAGRESRRRAGRARRRVVAGCDGRRCRAVTSVNHIREVKPGAVVLITGSLECRAAARVSPARRCAATSSPCSCISATVADCRSRFRFRIRGAGRWIRRRRTTIRPSSASGGRCCAG